MADVTPGWFPDPYGRYDQRYWDGEAWTDRVRGGALGGDEDESVDPLGTSMGIPFATPTGTSGGDDGTSAVARFLDGLGPDAKQRPAPNAARVFAGLGGVAITVGVTVAVVPESGPRAAILAVAVVALVLVLAIRLRVDNDELRAAAVGSGTVAIPMLGGALTITDGTGGFLPSFVIGGLFIAAWALPGFRGLNLFLGLGALTLLTAFGSLSSGDPDYDSVALVPQDIRDTLGGTGTIYLLGAIAFLAGTWWLDRRGYRGAGAALAAAAIVASIGGAALFSLRFGDTGGPSMMIVVGVLLALVGAHGSRRATTWAGALLATVGFVNFVTNQVKAESFDAVGVILIVCGLVLVIVPLAVQRARASNAVGAPADQ